MQSLQNFKNELAESDLNKMEFDIVQLIEFDSEFIVMTWDSEDSVYLVNVFDRKCRDFDNTHSWTGNYAEAFQIYLSLILSRIG